MPTCINVMKFKKALAWLILSCLVLALSFTLINTQSGLTGNVIASLEKFKLMPSRAESTAVLESAPLPTMCDGLNLTKLPKIHPESVGTNYNHAGTYNVSVGDGFIKGDVLIKITNITLERTPGRRDAGAFVRVFKKECDGRYYPLLVPLYSQLASGSVFDLYGLTIQLKEFISPTNITIIYYENCTGLFDYCDDPDSSYYRSSPSACSTLCPFEALEVRSSTDPSRIIFSETKASDGRFTVLLPSGYDELAEFTARAMKQCYNNVTAFLGYEPFKLRVGIQILEQASGSSAAVGDLEYVQMSQDRTTLDRETRDLSRLEEEMTEIPCPNIFLMGHEFVHVATTGVLSENWGIKEGIAKYVEQQLMYDYLMDGEVYTFTQCFEDNYDGIPYADLSRGPHEIYELGDYYQTGLCFWKDFVNTYGYANFTKLMEEAYTRSRGIGKYSLLDVMQDVLGEPVSEEILNRYSLTRESTMINACEGCEVYMPKYVLRQPIVPTKNLRSSIFRFFGKKI